MATPQEVLAGVPLFSMLPAREVGKLARKADDLTFPAGTVVTDVDRTGASFGVIVDGQAVTCGKGEKSGWEEASLMHAPAQDSPGGPAQR